MEGEADNQEPLPKSMSLKWYWVLIQITCPFLLAGMGTITAGVILGIVQTWFVFKQINELFILVPALCGLKGNLDMCVAARLSTLSNLGHMRDRSHIQSIVVGNLALVQCQATICSFLLGVFTNIVGAAVTKHIEIFHMYIVLSAAMFTASTSCLILDSVLMGMIIFSQKYHFNPDYMATPIVASIGDVISISLLAFSTSFLYDYHKTHLWIGGVLVISYLALLPLWIFIVLRNSYTRTLLKTGWLPVLAALCISEVGGLVLSKAVEKFTSFAVFSPIISGIGGNLISVQASHLGTTLYQKAELGTLPEGTKICERPDRTLFWGSDYTRLGRLLILISIPSDVVLVCIADLLYKSNLTVTPLFVVCYVVASLLQLFILLWAAHLIVHTLWRLKSDPDSASIPYLTALGDVLGSSLLTVVYYILQDTNQKYPD